MGGKQREKDLVLQVLGRQQVLIVEDVPESTWL